MEASIRYSLVEWTQKLRAQKLTFEIGELGGLIELGTFERTTTYAR